MIGHRPSALPSAQFCAQSALLGAQHGAGRAAAMSSAWHASCAGIAEAAEMMARLTPAEQTIVKSWPKPVDVVLENGLLLSYKTAERELPVAIDGWGEACKPDSPDCLTAGTLDFAWKNGETAYVADLKKSKWTSVEGPDSLQLQVYGWAFAKAYGCTAYITGLWIAESAEWQWSHDPVVLDSPEGEAILDRILAAASNGIGQANPPYCTGPHCASCYSRTYCPEHTLSAAAAETWLAPVTRGEPPAPDVAADLCARIKAASEILEKAEKQLKAWVERGELVITAPDGKIWVPVMHKGRLGLDKDLAVETFGQDAVDKCMRRGAPHPVWTWIKPKK